MDRPNVDKLAPASHFLGKFLPKCWCILWGSAKICKHQRCSVCGGLCLSLMSVPLEPLELLSCIVCSYIYICCRVKILSKICLFLSQKSVQVFLFFLSFFQNSSFCRKNEIFQTKNKTKNCHFLSQPFSHFWLFQNMMKPLFLWGGFSKNAI